MSTENSTPVRVYLARVRNALDDLPPAELEEVLDDVRPHLGEIVAELGPDARVDALIAQLGTPEAYAAELRAAGDYPTRSETVVPPTIKREHRMAPRLALWSVIVCAFLMGLFAVAAADNLHTAELVLAAVPLGIPVLLSAWYVLSRGTGGITALPEVRKFRSLFADDNRALKYLRSLLPAWPLVCAVVFVGLGLALFLRHTVDGLVALLLLAAIAAVVVATSSRLKVERRWLWLHVPVAAIVVGSGVGMASYFIDAIGHNGNSSPVSYSPATTVDGSPVLTYGGNQVGNIYAFDAQGKPLKDVYLFDDQGRPLNLPRYDCDTANGGFTKSGNDNRFPRPNAGPNVDGPFNGGWYDGNGNYNSGPYTGGSYSGNGPYGANPVCNDSTNPPFAAVIPTSTPTPTPSSSPTTSPTPSGTASPSPTPGASTSTPPKSTTSIKPPG
jgi:uncharacterized membrane protein